MSIKFNAKSFLYRAFSVVMIVMLAFAALPVTPASATGPVAVLQAWPATPQLTATNGNLSGTFTISAGTERLLVVAVDLADSTPSGVVGHTYAATYGGKALTQAASRRSTWIGYLKETDIASRVGNTLTVTITGAHTGAVVYIASYTGVNQTTPLSGSGRYFANNAGTLAIGPLAASAGGYGIYTWGGISGRTRTSDTETYVEHSDVGGGSHADLTDFGIASKAINASTNPTISWSGNARTSVSFITLNPAPAGLTAQTINITTPAPATATYRSIFTVAATASSGLTVAYSSGTPTVCTNVGAQFTIISGTGTCTVQYNQAGNGTYSAAPQLTNNVTAQPATLTYTANAASRTYGAANPAFTGTITGFLNGETQATATTGVLAFTSTATAASNIASYAINGSGLTANNGNYMFVQAAGNATALTVTPTTLTYTANAASRVFGAANPAFSGTVTGFVNGQTQATATTGVLAFTSTATAASSVGNYAITGSGLAANNGNYTFVQAAGNATALTITPAVVGTTYYVNNTNASCSDTLNTGLTIPLPFCTIGKGASVAVAGNTVRVLAGTYAETVALPRSGTSGNPITFSAAPGVIVTGNGTATGSAFRGFGLSYIVIDGFTINSTTEHGIYMSGSFFIYTNNIVTGSKNQGIFVLNSNNVTVSNNHVSTSGMSGIYINNTTASTVSGNTSDHNRLDGIRLNGSSNITVSNNITFANDNVASSNGNGIAVINSSANTILHNVIYANRDSGLQVSGGSSNNLVLGNLSYGNGDHGIDVTSNATANTLVGNTFQGNYTSGINLEANSTGSTVVNNIVADNGLNPAGGRKPYNIYVDATSVSGTTIDYNLYYLTSPYTSQVYWNNAGQTSLAAIQLATGQESHGVIGNPLFVAPAAPATDPPSVVMGDYHIASGSPAIDSANSNAPGEPLLDIEGNARMDTPVANTGAGVRTYDDRGAYESQTGTGGAMPAVTTEAVTAIGTTTATGNGTVTNLGAPNPYQYGVVWGTAANPTIALATKTTQGTVNATGAFTSAITGLTPGTLYHVRAYATNTTGTAYGADVSFVVTSTSVGTSGSPSVYGSSVTFTATVLPTTATGTVTFYDGVTVLGTGTLTAGTATFSTSALSVSGSPHSITATLAGSGIYGSSTSSAISQVITPATLTYTANTATRAYGAANPAFTGTVTGFVGTDTQVSATTGTPTFTSTATATSNFGSYAITGSGLTANNGNYTFVQAAGNATALTITPATLTITASSGSMTYGGTVPAITPSYSGLQAGDSAPATPPTCSTTATNTSPVGSYPSSCTGAVDANYTIGYFPGSVSVTPATLTITASSGTMTYGGTVPAITPSYSGLQAGDSAPATPPTCSTTATNTSPVGPYPSSCVGAVDANYTIGYTAGSVSIMPATTLIITASSGTMTYGGTVPTITPSYSGLQAGDSTPATPPTCSTTATNTSAVGSYPSSCTGAVDANYTIGYFPGSVSVTPAAATVTLSDLAQTYDGAPKSATVAVTPPGLLVNVTYDSSATAPTNAGSYAVVATITDINYSGSVSDTLIIGPATVDPGITASNKMYDGNSTASFTCTLTGVIGLDDVTCSGGIANFADPNVGTSIVTATGLGLSGADLGNYQLSSTPATDTADITPRTLHVTATGVNKVYDGTTAATVTLADDRVGGDDVTTGYTTASFVSPNLGSNITINVGGISITGGTASVNYVLGNVITTTAADITNATQTITVVTNAPPAASNGSTFDVNATASSGLPVTITTSGSCSGGDTDGTATITMTSGVGICSVFYNQDGVPNYYAAPQVQQDVTAAEGPAFTSADNTSFDVSFPGNFNITATGNPSTMTISLSGALPSGVTFTNNGDGTASLGGTPAVGTSGTYNLILTANNGVVPNAVQNFTLTVKNGPIVAPSGVNSIPDTGNGSISEGESIIDTLGITSITVQFSQDVYNPANDTDVKDVTNPANYLLVRSSSGTFSTVDCKSGLGAPDIAISVESVTYSNGSGAGPFIATFSVNGGLPLNVAGFYRLYVCGTTSIVDATNTDLILAGNGTTPGTDFQRNFRVTSQGTTGGGGGDDKDDNTASSFSASGLLIPVTGFSPNQVTKLPIQPADKAYKPLNELRIEIPTLGINFPIVGVSLSEDKWNLTWLKDSVGYLEGSAYPTWSGNTVLTAHVLDAYNNLGPFSDIKGMQLGQKIYIHFNRQVYVYRVQENKKILPSNISAVFKHEEDSWITLVTCENYNAKTALYNNRRVVRAVLISVIPEK